MESFLKELGIERTNSGACGADWIKEPSGKPLESLNPATGKPIATILQAGKADYERVMSDAAAAFEKWRMTPAPRRGEVIRQLGNALRAKKPALGALVALEMGKIRAEGEGEVQEMIDICDFAVGLSRQLYGLSMHSERPGHRMFEQWHPLGVVGIISAFNFPVAVWAWNSAIAAVCGDSMVWKPSSDTPLTAIAVQHICNEVLAANGNTGLMGLVIGKGSEVGEMLVNDPRMPLISATGSNQMGERIAKAVAPRFARTILELGGNNAIIVMDDADLDLTTRAVLFGAVGTAGQRCTTTRRLIMQKGIAGQLTERLVKAYQQVTIGDPLDPKTLMGPLVNEGAVNDMMAALEQVKKQGGEIIYGGKRLDRPGWFVEPTIVRAKPDMPIVAEETFAPILYLMECKDVDEGIKIQNGVTQGLSSSIFTRSLQAAETFLSARGSDCGIANVNIGTSGAEIGGAFGGEKATGGGREAGSDSWKQYMRRQTNTVNWSNDLPLAQGIKFG
ncbi:MAG: aldehyde dehydrogenase family protein [Deltaproteobacteria bacterium]|nr:aldehyde dehydrogenase family protein [Deltaproteobacteria bacterium]